MNKQLIVMLGPTTDPSEAIRAIRASIERQDVAVIRYPFHQVLVMPLTAPFEHAKLAILDEWVNFRDILGYHVLQLQAIDAVL
jgi:hypothetical protein